MKITEIKRHRVYLTTNGCIGRCEVVGGTSPASVMLVVVAPFPRGKCYFKPREIKHELALDDVPPHLQKSLFGN